MLDNILCTLVGGFVGAGASIVTQWVANILTNSRRRRAIAGAFAGEIGAICSIMRRRKYLEQGQQLLEHIDQWQQPLRVMMYITQDYLTIYHSNSSAIGLLPAPLALDVAVFYTQVKSLMEDVRPELPEPVGTEDAKARLTGQVNLLSETLGIGEGLVTQLHKVAR